MRTPEIKPGSQAWEARMIPPHYIRFGMLADRFASSLRLRTESWGGHTPLAWGTWAVFPGNGAPQRMQCVDAGVGCEEILVGAKRK
jgi:hypothetical protein